MSNLSFVNKVHLNFRMLKVTSLIWDKHWHMIMEIVVWLPKKKKKNQEKDSVNAESAFSQMNSWVVLQWIDSLFPTSRTAPTTQRVITVTPACLVTMELPPVGHRRTVSHVPAHSTFPATSGFWSLRGSFCLECDPSCPFWLVVFYLKKKEKVLIFSLSDKVRHHDYRWGYNCSDIMLEISSPQVDGAVDVQKHRRCRRKCHHHKNHQGKTTEVILKHIVRKFKNSSPYSDSCLKSHSCCSVEA